MTEAIAVRAAGTADLPAIEWIQQVSPAASQWPVSDYLDYDCRVAVEADQVAGFLAARQVAAGEFEILNLAVAPGRRRKGVGRALISALLRERPASVFLEVRESNSEARLFYHSLGFRPAGRRPGYYRNPAEDAVVMQYHSC